MKCIFSIFKWKHLHWFWQELDVSRAFFSGFLSIWPGVSWLRTCHYICLLLNWWVGWCMELSITQTTVFPKTTGSVVDPSVLAYNFFGWKDSVAHLTAWRRTLKVVCFACVVCTWIRIQCLLYSSFFVAENRNQGAGGGVFHYHDKKSASQFYKIYDSGKKWK